MTTHPHSSMEHTSTPHPPHMGARPHAHQSGPGSTPSASTEKRGESKNNGRAWAIGAILVIFLLVVGGLVVMRLMQTTEEPIPEPAVVEVKLIVDATCELCFNNNTILAKLEESHIAYEVTTYDMHSPEGQALIAEFEIEYAPTALVNVRGLDQNATIQAALQGQFIDDALIVKNGWVIVPEKFLDKQPHLLTFITKPETCEVPEGKIKITAHLDYGDCKPCREAYERLEVLKTTYPSLVVDYEPILYNRTTPSALLRAINANKGAVCAEKLGFMDGYTECNYFNAPFYGSLDLNQMRSCLIQAGGTSMNTRNEFMSCVQDRNSGAETILIENTEAMHKWNPLKYTPSFVFDCTYSILGHGYLENILCSLHPELECNIPSITLDINTSTGSDTNGIVLNANHVTDSNADVNA